MYIFSGYYDQTSDDPRSYVADQLAHMFRTIATSGVKTLGTNLKVESYGNSMTVRILEGSALVNGYVYVAAEDGGPPLTIDLDVGGNYNRIDRIVLECNTTTNVRDTYLKVLKGTAGANAQPPELVRDESYYQISLAQVKVEAGKTIITAANITDERENEAVCGIVAPHYLRPSNLSNLHTHPIATAERNGFMSAAQAKRLDELAANKKANFAGANLTDNLDMNGKYIDNALFR